MRFWSQNSRRLCFDMVLERFVPLTFVSKVPVLTPNGSVIHARLCIGYSIQVAFIILANPLHFSYQLPYALVIYHIHN